MNKSYSAVYYNPAGQVYDATIFLSTITLSIRYKDHNEWKDVYWLADNIVSLEEKVLVSVIEYKNKDGKTERLVIRDGELLQAIKKNFNHHRFVGGWKYHVFGNTKNKLLLFIAVIIVLILTGYFLFIPWLGDRIARNISKEWEINMGEKMHQSIIEQYRIDSAKTRLINRFYKELAYSIDYPINVTVVESKEVNAYAVPGGHIVVYTSILNRMQKPEELAALLSHEASHIQLRHSLRNIFRSMARKMFLILIIGNETGLAGFLIDNADNLKSLEYSRQLETEADNSGIRLMQLSNIDATGMLRLMRILQKENKEKETTAFLSTHPVFKNRMENIKKQLKSNTKTLKKELLESIFSEMMNDQR